MGDIIGSRFELGEPLGQGGMGTVYRGVDTQTGQPVAIKLLRPEVVAGNAGLVERFAREGEALRRLNHPNIVKVLATVDQAGNHYLVMEYVGGGSLADLLEHNARLPIDRTLQIALELADALTRAHHLKIIHRDIKPANVLLAEDGTPRLTDFGIARLDDQTRMTESGLVVGTFAYLSPEACEGRELDPRTDIWAFGVMLYEMLTSKRPFDEDNLAATVTAILTKSPPDLAALRPDTPPALVTLINRMLAKDRDQRIPSVRQVGAELETILRGDTTPSSVGAKHVSPLQPETSRFATSTPTPDLEGATTIAPTPTPPAAARRSSWRRIALIGGAALVLIGLLGWGYLRLTLNCCAFPTITPTPLVQPVAQGEFIVLVAPFEAVKTDTRDVARFIADDLRQQLEVEAPFSKLRVRQYPNPIQSDDDARAAAEATGASVVVWGSYTADKITANVQIGSLTAFKYNQFDRATLERTANVRAEMTDETTQSLAPQVLAVLGVLFNADGDVYRISRTWIALKTLKTLNAATVVGTNVAAQTYGYFANYVDNPTQSVDALNQAINLDAKNALLYGFRNQAVYRMGAINSPSYHPVISRDLVNRMNTDAASTAQLGPANWSLAAVLTYHLEPLPVDYDQIVALRPDDWYVYFLRFSSSAYHRADDNASIEDERQDLDHAIALHPDYPFPQAFAVSVALIQGRIVDAAALADNVRSATLPDTFFIEGLLLSQWGAGIANGSLYVPFSKMIVGQYQEALDNIVQQAVGGGNTDPFWLGLAQCGAGGPEKAALAFDSVNASQNYFIVHLFKAQIALKQGDRQEALQQIGIVQHSDQADALAPFAAAVLDGEFGCKDLFNSAKIQQILDKYGKVTSSDIAATLTAAAPINTPPPTPTPTPEALTPAEPTAEATP